jgi:hypothetical protein
VGIAPPLSLGPGLGCAYSVAKIGAVSVAWPELQGYGDPDLLIPGAGSHAIHASFLSLTKYSQGSEK